MNPRSRFPLLHYFACLVTGFAILVLELVSFRIFAPHFGVSIHVTGIIINGILLALAVGYVLGGRAADRGRSEALPYVVILASAIYLAFAYACYGPILPRLRGLSVSVGAALAIAILFLPPIALLAFVPPYFIKTIARSDTVGTTAGRVYAISTLGSLGGGLAATFVFIPYLGSRTTFMIAIALLGGTAAAGLTGYRALTMLALILLLPLMYLMPTLDDGENLYRGESEYNVIMVDEEDGRRLLRLNDASGFHSKGLDPDTMLSGDYYDDLLVAHMFTDPRRTLILGNGAGTSMMQAAHFFDTHVVGVEIDPRLTDVGWTYFGLTWSEAMTVVHDDARTFMNSNARTYDVIIVDVYAGSPFVPFHVATVEFYERIRASLKPDGVVAVNVPFYSHGTELRDHFVNTIARVFPNTTHVSGCTAFAFGSEVNTADLKRWVSDAAVPEALREVGNRVASNLERWESSPSDEVFTDDRAPVAMLTYGLIKEGLEKYTECNNLRR